MWEAKLSKWAIPVTTITLFRAREITLGNLDDILG